VITYKGGHILMKKIILIISMFIILVSLTGCGSKANEEDGATSINDSINAIGENPLPRQGQFERADLIGEVSEVNGREITLKLIQMPQFQGRRGEGQNGAGRPERADRPQGEGRTERVINYTGESKIITIPENVDITSFNRGENGPGAIKIDIKDIKAGDMLQIWYSEEDENVITRISLGSFMR
jgi:hypothetical protein